MGGSLKPSVDIAVIFPSRGLVFSRTAEELLNMLKGYKHKIYFAHKQPIPDCFEKPLTTALSNKEHTHILIVEDDMILPVDTLKKLLELDVAVATADYPINKEGRGSVFRDKAGKIIFCGTGCLLVKREVFNELRKPYFRTNTRWNVKNMGKYIKFTGSENTNLEGYGLHDINFCMELQRLKIPIHCIDTVLGQRKLINLGKAGSNDGAHNIELWTKVKKDHMLKQIMKWPVTETGELTTVIMNDGKEINLSKKHATKLVRKKMAKRPPKRASVIDWSDSLSF